MTRNNDWWGYFGSFLIGKENLVLDQSFVLEIKFLLSKLNFQELVKYLHDKHFSSAYYFIYLNILPSLSGLYFITPGKDGAWFNMHEMIKPWYKNTIGHCMKDHL